LDDNNGDAVNTTTDNDEIIGDVKKIVIGKTQQLFNSKGLESMISVKGDSESCI
jgi:hypothetical protein